MIAIAASLEGPIMNLDENRKKAELLFKRSTGEKLNAAAREQRSREIREKIQYLRSLRKAAQVRPKSVTPDGSSEGEEKSSAGHSTVKHDGSAV